ncbi:tRNA epoxyqueuosine(34) reductase QueG [Pokkaliibacter plantistimulans]|uniref:Epoxyqueuosine reductase n=1 Tax=Proteobacteria bacterium 228 TaxID=2083153 RepID=A0A2S5KH82_9PROT|nr:tRNA epoxyqueuosine(34) reductase QueG [Pokkaliibacter plantistimulans]
MQQRVARTDSAILLAPNSRSTKAVTTLSTQQLVDLTEKIRLWARELGFQDMGVSSLELGDHPEYMRQWVEKGLHGEMSYLENNQELRRNPALLHEGTLSIISVRMDYLPPETQALKILNSPAKAYVSRYALGRDYHKVIRKRLTQLAKQIEQNVGTLGYRAFVDSAPVMEKPIAEQAGLGWMGKNSLIMNRKAGSWFFLGELYTNLPLINSAQPVKEHCGRCSACMDLCPTNAFIGPKQLDARRCISYLTIEYRGSIPTELRPLMGNRIYGCDDCQLVCPWNRFASSTHEQDFHPRHSLDSADLLTLFEWDEATFLTNTEGSPIRRTGYEGWQRNIAIALGNAPFSTSILSALQSRLTSCSSLVGEHIEWAISQQLCKAET